MAKKYTLLEDLSPIVIQILSEELDPGAKSFINREKTVRSLVGGKPKGWYAGKLERETKRAQREIDRKYNLDKIRYIKQNVEHNQHIADLLNKAASIYSGGGSGGASSSSNPSKPPSSGIGKLLGLGAVGAGAGAYALRDKIAGLFAGHHDNDDEA
jgi:hypothetical protein